MENEHDGRQVAVRSGLTITGVVVPALIGTGLSMVGFTPPEFTYARWCFAASAVLLGGLGAGWLIVTDQSFGLRLFWGAVLGLLVFVLFPLAMRWVTTRQEVWVASQVAAAAPAPAPSTAPAAGTAPPDPSKALTDRTRDASPQPAGRRLNRQQAESIMNHLYNKNFYKFAYGTNSIFYVYRAPVAGDINTYANDFTALLNLIGITTSVVPRTPSGLGQTGLMVSVPDINKPPEGARVLFDALKTGGLSPRYVPFPDDTRSGGGPGFALFVGPPS